MLVVVSPTLPCAVYQGHHSPPISLITQLEVMIAAEISFGDPIDGDDDFDGPYVPFTTEEHDIYSGSDYTTLFGNVFGQCCAVGENCCQLGNPSRPVLVPK